MSEKNYEQFNSLEASNAKLQIFHDIEKEKTKK